MSDNECDACGDDATQEDSEACDTCGYPLPSDSEDSEVESGTDEDAESEKDSESDSDDEIFIMT